MLWILWLLAGCIYEDERDCDSGLATDTAGSHGVCRTNDDCPGAFACGDWTEGSVPERTSPDGCFERCMYDNDCKAGYRCDTGTGECVDG